MIQSDDEDYKDEFSFQINLRKIKNAAKLGLKPFDRPLPMNLTEWANKNFYLSSESSYVEGPWDTLPFQLAPMNSMGHPDIRVFNFIKSARVGYTQMIRAAIAYFIEHKARNQIVYQPSDGAAAKFMKAHIETMIRDVKPVKQLAPWHGRKHRDSTIDTKVFTNKKSLWVLGGKSAKNYREKSPDNVFMDELSGFDSDIEKEGSPTRLADKRVEGSAFAKLVRGSTPKVQETCLITKEGEESDMYFEFWLPCPECTQEQVLRWGGKDVDFGIKWENEDPKTAHYVCEHCASIIENESLESMEDNGVWRCKKTESYTKDGIDFFSKEDKRIDAPDSITYWIWTAYSLFTTWSTIVRDFLKCKGDRNELKTFTNTTLGETWVEEEGEQLDHEVIHGRREHYLAECPVDAGIITCAVDTQDDRLEVEHVVWVEGEESYRLNYKRLYGDLSKSGIWDVLKKEITRRFVTPSGAELEAKISFIDSGGHYTDEVYNFCRKNGVHKFVPIKGHSKMGKPIATWPRKRNDKRVYLVMIGTDTAKEVIVDRLKNTSHGEGYMHYPFNDSFDEDFFKHLTNEKRKVKFVGGRRCFVWDAGGRPNEPFDLAVYNLAAIRTLKQHFGVRLPSKQAAYPLEGDKKTDNVTKNDTHQVKQLPKAKKSAKIKGDNDFINISGDWL